MSSTPGLSMIHRSRHRENSVEFFSIHTNQVPTLLTSFRIDSDRRSTHFVGVVVDSVTREGRFSPFFCGILLGTRGIIFIHIRIDVRGGRNFFI